jgi:hypothetical protein
MRSKLLPLLAVPVLALGAYLALRPTGASQGPGGAAPVAAGAPEEPQTGAAELRATAEAAAGPSGARSVAEASPSEPLGRPEPAGAPLAALATPQARLLGRVVDGEGRPVAGAEVELVEPNQGFRPPGDRPESPSVRSQADGRFVLPILSRGPSEGLAERFGFDPAVSVRAATFAPLRQPVGLPPAGDVDLGDLALGPGLILSGRLLDADGQPVAGAELSARAGDVEGMVFFAPNGGTPDAVTDPNGGFRLDVLAFAAWTIHVEHPRFPGKDFRGVPPQQGREMEGLVFELDRPATIAGVVRGRPNDGRAYEVRSQRVSEENGFFGGLVERSALVDSGGRFQLEGLANGSSYSLTLHLVPDEQERYLARFEGPAHALSKSVTAAAGSQGVELVYLAGSKLCFQLVDDLSGEPIERFEATLQMGFKSQSRGGEGDTFEEGRLCFEDLRPLDGVAAQFGEAPSLSLRAPGYADLDVPLPPLVAGTPIDLGVLRARPVPRVTVRLVDDQDGTPVAGARVTLSAGDGGVDRSMVRVSIVLDDDVSMGSGPEVAPQTAESDEQGRVVFNAFAGQTATLEVESLSHAMLSRSGLKLETEQPSEIELRLLRGASVRILAKSREGQPLVGAKIQSRPEEVNSGEEEFVFSMFDRTTTRTTDELGQAVFEHLTAGAHRFWIEPKRAGAEAGAILFLNGGPKQARGEVLSVAEGESAELVLVAPPEAELRGRILESGAVLAGASLALRKADSEAEPWMMDLPTARCDGDGRYRLAPIEPGEYVAVITAPSRSGPHEVPLRIEEGENRLDLDLGVAILEGRVVDHEGRPVQGITVRALPRAEDEAGTTRISRSIIVSSGGTSLVGFGDSAGEPVRTDAEGRYRLRGVSAGRDLEVLAEPGTEQPMAQSARSEPVRVSEGETRRVPDLTLGLAGELLVRLVGSDGLPVTPGWVMARPAEGTLNAEPRFQPSDEKGQVRLTGLEPGRWTVSGQRMGPGSNPAVEQDFEVVAGEKSEGRIELP